MENILYLIAIFSGFIICFISVLLFNKKYKVMSIENCIYSYIMFFTFFLIFSKIIHIFIDKDLISIHYLFSKDLMLRLRFIFSGYSFIGGYIGGLISLPFLSKLFKVKIIDLILLYIPNILIMYSILKIGCYIKGCCYGITEIPIQLIETVINLIAYLIVLYFVFKDISKYKIVGISLILFGILRFIISLFRVFVSVYTLIFIEVFCLLLILLGIILIKKYTVAKI